MMLRPFCAWSNEPPDLPLDLNKTPWQPNVMTIFEFCRSTIAANDKDYRAGLFRGEGESRGLFSLLECAEESCPPHRTEPGKFSDEVSVKNTGETAFQRAIYKDPNRYICFGNQPEPITWNDIELPITFSNHGRNHGRRRCIDLIGCTKSRGTFLCELKHAKERHAPAGNLADHAILEALIYYGIVARDHAKLDEAGVRRDACSPFQWAALKDSRTILVLANFRFWEKARKAKAASRIHALVNAIEEKVQVKVLLIATPDYHFRDLTGHSEGKYRPRLLLSESDSAPWAKAL